MKARITFRSEIYIDGDDAKDIMRKFMLMNLYSKEAISHSIDFVEINSMEDEDNIDILSELN